MAFQLGALRQTFPLGAHSSGRYLVDAHGEPFLLVADTAWSGIADLSTSEMATYLDDCKARGFNAVIVNLLEHLFASDPPNDMEGNAPFSGTAFQSSLNSAYTARAVRFVADCLRRGICCMLNPAYIGFNGTEEGWDTELAAASQAQVESYARAVAALFAPYPNIVWHVFGDATPGASTLRNRVNQLSAALLAADPSKSLISAHYAPGTGSWDSPESYFTYHWAYTQTIADVPQEVREGYQDSAEPTLFCEGRYEQESSATAADARFQAWHPMLSGACGTVYGHRDIWGFGFGLNQTGTWQNAVANAGGVADGRTQMIHLRQFFAARAWHLLVPDFPASATFVTAGRGTEGDAGYVSAALASDDSWGAAYLPTGSSGGAITVDRTEFSGAFSWTWYNPRTGGTSGGASGVANTGTENYTAPDTNDWVWVGEVD